MITQQNNVTSTGRRQFLKASVAASGGLMISFSWPGRAAHHEDKSQSGSATELNAYLLVDIDGSITAMVPNPEFGQNVMTSMPMILAEEMDADWQHITAQQADFMPEEYDRQFTGGSQSMRQGWKPLRTAGAGARTMLVKAAAAKWQVPTSEITVKNSVVSHGSGKSASFAELAADAALMTLPDNITLKNPENFTVIGQSKTNLTGNKVVTGQPMFGIDYKADGKNRSLTVEGIAAMAVEAIEGGDGSEVTISNNPLGVVPGVPVVVARASRLSYNDHGMEWEISGKNGYFSKFSYEGP